MPESAPVTIYHNPACGTSRSVLATLRDHGVEPEIIEYLKAPPDRATLEKLIAQSGVGARGVLRGKEPLAKELGLDDPLLTDSQLIDAMMKHPVLINRPLVVTPRGTRLCRPAESVLELLRPD